MSNSITNIAADIFGLTADKLRLDMTPDDIDAWDSLNHMRLVTAVEAELGIRLSMQQIQGIQSLGDFGAFEL